LRTDLSTKNVDNFKHCAEQRLIPYTGWNVLKAYRKIEELFSSKIARLRGAAYLDHCDRKHAAQAK
jgi:hypothetical protein